MRRQITMLLAIVLLTLVATQGTAVEQRALPSFQVQRPDGAAVDSASLSREAKWILIYVLPDCEPCDTLLRRLSHWEGPQLAARVFVVVGATVSAAQAYLEKNFPGEMPIAWYADGDGQAWQTLGIKGTPVLFGIRHGRIEWALSGLTRDPGSLTATIRSWIEY